MKTILYISSSVRDYQPNQTQHQSITKMLGEQFTANFKAHHEHTEVIYRDLNKQPPSFINADFIGAAFSKAPLSIEQQKQLAESDQLIAEIVRADIIVIASPMYNYGMPAILKAWFDLVIRVDKTFSFDLARGDEPLAPILSGKSVVLLVSWGEFAFKKGQAKAFKNHLSGHIEQLAPYLGASQFYEIASEYQEFGDKRHQASKQQAIEATASLAEQLATN
ncbi:NAD(P)H-dependent oxidoreductase [Catenovulum sp. SM1970]|uniref:FMN-dependent NADH-azoreductase n=1 Tax=Marinifaba aquimaris TaxID=2741323 RepID=UPI0015731555|nr:NAD(P)H-dependent oxidoreductase [Marinifaba aquimaris]NTS78192.1 NAD(P)H-dependent oxidoreductase [Marinifaba aquimaris]